MIPLAAALPMQAAAVDAGAAPPAAFGLASAGVAPAVSTAEATLDEIGELISSACPRGPSNEVVICGRRSRTSYRTEPSRTERREDRAPAGELLVDHSGCGVRQRVTGRFAGVVVLKTTFGAGGGETTLLPTLTNTEGADQDPS